MRNPNNIVKVPYKTLSGRICITPCPYKCGGPADRPFVGSMNCEMCTCFVSKDRKSQTVECMHTEYSSGTYLQRAKVKYTLQRIEDRVQKKQTINKYKKCT